MLSSKRFNTKSFVLLLVIIISIGLLIIFFIKNKIHDQRIKNIRRSPSIRDVYTTDSVDDEELSDYILLKSYDVNPTDKGGFYWWVHQVTSLVRLGELTNKKVLVYFDDGYYKDDTRPEHSWWNYFFKYPMLTDKHVALINRAEKEGFRFVDNLRLKEKGKMYLFDFKSFQDVMRSKMTDVNGVYKRFLKIQEPVIDVFKTFLIESGLSNNADTWRVGVHYRGTDKFFANGDQEDLALNEHLKYEEVSDMLKKLLTIAPEGKQKYIYAASDEQPFVDFIKNEFKDTDVKVISYGAFRSSINTSGISLPDTSKVTVGDGSEMGQLLLDISKQSVHRGNNDISGYTKGVDAIIDVWMLSTSDVYLKTQKGNFSSQPEKWNKNLKVYEMT